MTLRSKARHEGLLILDNRMAPPFPSDFPTHINGKPLIGIDNKGAPEFKTYTCSHCNVVVVQEPRRTRERAYCPKCDHYICDKCGLVYAQKYECGQMNARIEKLQEQTFLAEQAGRGNTFLINTGDTGNGKTLT